MRPGNMHSADGWRDGLEPVAERYREPDLRRYFRGDAAFASPDIHEFLEAEGFLFTVRLPTNPILQKSITHLLTRPIGRPPNHVRRYYASFSYQAGSWDRKRRVVAKVEWHPGKLVPPVTLDPLRGSSVTNLSRAAERVIRFYDGRGTAEQFIKDGKNLINWTRVRRTYARPLDGRSRLTTLRDTSPNCGCVPLLDDHCAQPARGDSCIGGAGDGRSRTAGDGAARAAPDAAVVES